MRAMWTVVVLMSLGACDRVLGLPEIAVHHDAAVGATVDAPPDTPDAPYPSCPTGYLAVGGGYYRASGIAGTPLTWQGAEAACEADGANALLHTHLVVFDDAAEVSAVSTQLGTLPSDNWVGYDDIKSNTNWQPVTDQANTDMPWANSYPSNFAADQCADFQSTGKMKNPAACDTASEYICECDGHAADPTHW